MIDSDIDTGTYRWPPYDSANPLKERLVHWYPNAFAWSACGEAAPGAVAPVTEEPAFAFGTSPDDCPECVEKWEKAR